MELKPIQQSFSVAYAYKLYFTNGLFDTENTLFRDIMATYKPNSTSKVLFIVDDGVVKKHKDLLAKIDRYCNTHKKTIQLTQSIIVKGGEQTKNSEKSLNKVLKGVNENGICRHSFVVVIGGGAVIDMAGYAAAIAHRGVKLIRIPTTVLSQNDSAVGVKNSINIFGKKNFIGTFAPPYAIINDNNFLTTLQQRDWIAGIAEAIKVALIKDASFFDYVRKHTRELREREMEPMQYTIYRCAEMHMQHIAGGGDPFENGSSRPLDFGHWAAHKLEHMSNYKIRHGEAVAKGMALDVTYAHLTGLIPAQVLDQIITVMQQIGFDLQIPVKTDSEINELLNGIQEFREHLGGELTITLINGIGKKYDVHQIDMEVMKEAITHLNNRSKLNVA
ncbi:3-dehydroquinate synthase [Muriicola sp. Z0-33]|nr:3-dehydroquinate synthase [Muriicola sp. Z0-33]